MSGAIPPFSDFSLSISGSFEAITPNDSNIIGPYRAVWAGGAGNIAVLGVYDTVPVTITGLAAGSEWRGAIKKVLSTGTTATGLIGYR